MHACLPQMIILELVGGKIRHGEVKGEDMRGVEV
jgi:hypothetical protein